MTTQLNRIAVIGGGLMGSGIAEVSARAGLDVVVIESTESATETARTRLERSLMRAAERGKVEDPSAVMNRIRVTTALEDVADRELVIEAIVEDEAAKVSLFERLDELVEDPDAILASNTSSIRL